MRKHHSHETAFRLHIDAKPSDSSAKKLVPSLGWATFWPSEARPTNKHFASHSYFHTGKFPRFLKDSLHFIFVSFLVFVSLYTIINWQALTTLALHYVDVWRGFESPLQTLVEEKKAAPEKLPSAPGKNSGFEVTVPALNLEVYPPDMRIIIPRINQNVPVIGVRNENLIKRQWDNLEKDIQEALRSGVIHYPGTALPGDNGNVVLTGHSSYYAWDPGRFKDVFVLLHELKEGDKIVVYFNQKKFVYAVSNIKIVLPKDVDVLAQTDSEQLTLITCTPIGTNLKRLIVTAKLIEKS